MKKGIKVKVLNIDFMRKRDISAFQVNNSGIHFSPTKSQIQKAKDFIWEHLEPHNQKLVIDKVTTDWWKDKGLITDKVIIGFEYK